MTDFRYQAEHIKLARVLSTHTEQLEFLSALNSSDLQNLRLACVNFLNNKQRTQFKRVASASKLLPTALTALIADHAMGPLLCARVANEFETRRAIDIALHLSPAFMARTAIYLDTDRARDLTQALPIKSVIAIAHELVRNQEFITLGDLVGTLPLPIIEAVVRALNNGEALLRIAFFVESPARLNEVMHALPLSALQSAITAAADERSDLWPHALALMSVVAPEWQVRLANMACDSGAETLSAMLRGVEKHQLWETVLPLIHLMSAANRRQLINLPELNSDTTLSAVLDAAIAHQLWEVVLPLIPLMNPDLQTRTAKLANAFSAQTVSDIAKIAQEKNLWEHAIALVQKMSAAHRRHVVKIISAIKSDEENYDDLQKLMLTLA